MARKLISSGSKFEELARYSRAVVDGDLIAVSGTIGADPRTGRMPESAEEQARNSFTVIESALRQAGASLANVVHCRVFVTGMDHVQDTIRVLAEKFDHIRPANTTVICQLPVPGAKVEIEVLARLTVADSG
jgi:enamine deaminase RidA (YjgF/YER057c/UK114 family)